MQRQGRHTFLRSQRMQLSYFKESNNLLNHIKLMKYFYFYINLFRDINFDTIFLYIFDLTFFQSYKGIFLGMERVIIPYGVYNDTSNLFFFAAMRLVIMRHIFQLLLLRRE
jgi:hypothetical protein